MTLLRAPGQKTAIGELETAAVVAALRLWGPTVEGRHLVSFVDNEGSKHSLVKGYSDSESITKLCSLADGLLDQHRLLIWFSRVPSSSNIADAPSRSEVHPFLRPECQCPTSIARESFAAVVHDLGHRQVGDDHGRMRLRSAESSFESPM